MTGPLAISLGDPAGIGPEIILRSWVKREEYQLSPFMVAGGAKVLADAAQAMCLDISITNICAPAEAAEVFPNALPVLNDLDGEFLPGQPTKTGALLAMQSLELAANLAIEGEACGMVTAPVSKAELAKVGFAFPGQTEFVADATNVEEEDAVMMLAGPGLKAVPLTIHVALSEVSGLLTQELIVRRCRVIAKAMQRDYALDNPRIALAGLNPHAGEKGRMGGEEEAVIAPAIAQLQSEGINATGPHPADTMFAAHGRQTYDVAVAMYHDQALVPLKALYFDEGVNVTLGLPIIRTSPDHGTAFNIAGQGTANPLSMIAAIRAAGEIAQNRAKSA